MIDRKKLEKLQGKVDIKCESTINQEGVKYVFGFYSRDEKIGDLTFHDSYDERALSGEISKNAQRYLKKELEDLGYVVSDVRLPSVTKIKKQK